MARQTVTGDIFRAKVVISYDDGSTDERFYGPYSKAKTAKAAGKGQTRYSQPGQGLRQPRIDASGFHVKGPDGRYIWDVVKTITHVDIHVEQANTTWSEVDSTTVV